ncbi:MAG: response regulator transcription factor [Ruminococcus sp.]|nr:response regulator transcription factor [Ruminococcus sp.]
MRIGICDDEKLQREYLSKLCLECADKLKIDCDIVEFSAGQDVLNYQGEMLTLLLLDIEMEGINGIEVKEHIEHSNMIWRIIFVSNHEDCVWSAFGINTLAFERKPISRNRMERWIRAAVKEFDSKIIIKFEKDNTATWSKVENLLYLRAEGNYTIVHTKYAEFIISKSLKYWQEQLPKDRMIRVHRSYLVNLDYVENVAKDEIRMKHVKKSIPIGRTNKKNFIIRYQAFIQERIRSRLR